MQHSSVPVGAYFRYAGASSILRNAAMSYEYISPAPSVPSSDEYFCKGMFGRVQLCPGYFWWTYRSYRGVGCLRRVRTSPFRRLQEVLRPCRTLPKALRISRVSRPYRTLPKTSVRCALGKYPRCVTKHTLQMLPRTQHRTWPCLERAQRKTPSDVVRLALYPFVRISGPKTKRSHHIPVRYTNIPCECRRRYIA